MEKRPTKKIKLDDTTSDNIDRLSSLPDCLLLQILSPLPTFSIVATSILSKRWRNLWTQLSHLNFSFEDDFASIKTDSLYVWELPDSQIPQLFNAYLTTIDEKILPRLTSPKIHVFELSLCEMEEDYEWTHCSNLVRKWLVQICSRNPEVIKLCISEVLQYDPSVVVLPSCVFQCESLELGIGFDFDFSFEAINISLPKLKKLSICLDDKHRKLMATLFKSCPMLQDLHIDMELNENDHLVDISSCNLRRLELKSVGVYDTTMFRIGAPNLEEFVISCQSGLVRYQFVSKLGELLYKADFNIYSKCSEHTIFDANKLVKELGARAHSLRLRGYVFTYLDLAEVNGKVTIFPSLTELEFQCWPNFMGMLHCCPNLEKIVWPTVYKDPINVVIKDLKKSKVPSCLSKNVKRIKVGCLKGTMDELEVLKYILTYAEVLEHLTVHVGYTRKEEMGKDFMFYHQLFCFPRKLGCCTIEFYGKYVTASSKRSKDGIFDCQAKCPGELSGLKF